MTNDKFKPNAPKTYEQFVLDNQLEQNQAVVNIYAAELGAYGGLEEVQKGYGPCAVCSKTTTTVELKVACPAKNCSNRKETYWVHNKSDCIKNKNRMLISNKG
jgi:hypothetical protein